MEIYIVTTKDIISQFQNNFKEFKTDLGKSFTRSAPNNNQQSSNNKPSIIEIKDNFVERFINESGNFCFKMGRMGVIHFYTCPEIDQQIWLYAKSEKLVIPCRKSTKIDINYLGNILLEMENILNSTNTNSFSNTINNYYDKKNLSGAKSTDE